VLCSHRTPGLMYLLNRCPDRSVAYEIVCVVTSEETFAEEVRVERRGIPTLTHPIADFYAARGASLYRDVDTRAEYDAETVKRLEPYFVDVILLDGYLYLVTTPLLKAFPNRIINLHFADLTVRRADGGPRFPGIRAVGAAIAAGCRETRATVHLVNQEPDDGAPIVRSWPFPTLLVAGELMQPDLFRAYVSAHQQSMMDAASGPLIAAALRLIATGAIDMQDLAGGSRPASTSWLLEEDGRLQVPELWEAARA
jgi:folate-dependent phosphoribosylglycinamide formyltransferase PurN